MKQNNKVEINSFCLFDEINKDKVANFYKLLDFYIYSGIKSEICRVYIDSVGGYTKNAIEIRDLLLNAYDSIEAIIVGEVHSGAAWFVLNCDVVKIIINKGMLVHTCHEPFLYYSESSWGRRFNKNVWMDVKHQLPKHILRKVIYTNRDYIIDFKEIEDLNVI